MMNPKPLVIYPADQLRPYRVDDQYASEAEVAEKIGFQIAIIDHDAMEVCNISQAFKRFDLLMSEKKDQFSNQAVYRGWMLTEPQYQAFEDGLAERGIGLLTDTHQYTNAHHYHKAYQTLVNYMAKSWFITEDLMHDDGYLAYALDHLPKGPLVIKDWVKSQASYWDEACFILDSSDVQNARKIINRFIELQGSDLVGGIVLREYRELVPNEEWRAFVVEGEIMGCWPKTTGKISPPEDLVEAASRLVFSRFASIDFALKVDGDWLVIETGDGQVSEFPPTMPRTHIFLSLKETFQMDLDVIEEVKGKI